MSRLTPPMPRRFDSDGRSVARSETDKTDASLPDKADSPRPLRSTDPSPEHPPPHAVTGVFLGIAPLEPK